MHNILQKVNNGDTLSFEEVKNLFNSILSGEVSEAAVGSALIAMKLRGETAEEIAAAATILNENKVSFPHTSKETIDTCGTGGDGKSTLNVSTAVSLVLSAMGINVLKHGNIAQSGKVGSADILEEVGIPTKLDEKNSLTYFRKNNFIFLFAPAYHPALKNVGKIRKELRVPTIFNYLGPMLNPGNPDYQSIGINRADKLDLYADALNLQGRSNVTVYSSSDGFDEISSSGKTFVRHIKDGKINKFDIEPAEFFEPFKMPVIQKKDDAKKFFLEALEGKNEQLTNLVAINTAVSLYTMNRYCLKDGFDISKNALINGDVTSKLQNLTIEKAV